MWFAGTGGNNNNNNNNNNSQKSTTSSPQVSSKGNPIQQAAQFAPKTAQMATGGAATGGFSGQPTTSPVGDLLGSGNLNNPSSGGSSINTGTMQQQQTLNNVQTTSDRPEKVSFYLKTSIFTRRVTVDSDKMALGMIKQLAVSFLNELYFQHQFPQNTYIGSYIKKHFSNNDNINDLFDRLILRKYLPEQEIYVPFNLVSDIEPESLISIEVAEKVVNYLSDHQQHLHHLHHQQQQQQHHHHHHHHHHSVGNQTSALQTSNQQQQLPLKISHEFKLESFMLPAYCASCSALIKGFYRQGYQCSYCDKKFCPKCKTKAEQADEACLAPLGSPGQSGRELVKLAISNNDNGSSSPEFNGQANQKSGSTSSNSSSGNANNSSRLEVLGVSMTKRKSTSNLLLFNLANPFKSHHNNNSSSQQGGQQQSAAAAAARASKESPKTRGSTGNLEPALPKFENRHHQRDNNNQNLITMTDCSSDNNPSEVEMSNLMVAQSNHISSSHQNLFTDTNEQRIRNATLLATADDQRLSLAGSVGDGQTLLGAASSAFQSSGGSGSGNGNGRSHTSQLSNSANTSTQDLCLNSVAGSMKPRDLANHLFISMDWIQINGEPLCGVCNKVLKTNQQQQQQQQSVFAPFMCKTCKLQVHAQCQNLVLTDCMSRIAESSRAAAAAQASSTEKETSENGQVESGAKIRSSNSNASRDNIRLHRLAPSVKHTKRPDSTVPIIEGWLKHTTLSDEQARQHYWRLDETDITLYENDSSTRYFKAIALSKIKRVMSANSLPKRVKEDVLIGGAVPLASPTTKTGGAGSSPSTSSSSSSSSSATTKSPPKSANTSPARSPELLAQMGAMFAFELATGSMYLVQASSESEASRWKESLAAMTAKRVASNEQQPPADSTGGGGGQSQVTSDKKEQSKGVLNKLVESVTKFELSKRDQSSPGGTKLIDSAPVTPETAAAAAAAAAAAVASAEPPAVDKSPPPPPPASSSASVSEQPNLEGTSQVRVLQQQNPPNLQHKHQHHHHHYPPSSTYLQHHHHHHRAGGHKTYTDPNRSRLYNRPRIVIKLDPMSVPDHLVAGKYLIERDRVKGVGFEELGSGQFGKVYAAISEYKKEDSDKGLWSGVPVAIKEISKARFDLRQQAKLKNEANILSHLDHPGVIILERVHDLPDKIFIVMEQLEDDMLEMIVSTPEKRLNERITKFLTYQILEALKYLHGKNIAHCDLKPENVLLVERRSQFPQIKLCDFGFAKIIEENSFRSSLVGTPAYLAPEVVKGERYNRSVDLWSVGVIVYVSLSGEFPFNEGENIHDQISRANFMYPDQPWAKISAQAKNFINSLLRVNCERRLSSYKAQMDEWLQDYQLWCDLCELEVRVNRRWVTDDADYAHWSKYAKKHSLQIPRSSIQLHEELVAD